VATCNLSSSIPTQASVACSGKRGHIFHPPRDPVTVCLTWSFILITAHLLRNSILLLCNTLGICLVHGHDQNYSNCPSKNTKDASAIQQINHPPTSASQSFRNTNSKIRHGSFHIPLHHPIYRTTSTRREKRRRRCWRCRLLNTQIPHGATSHRPLRRVAPSSL
jgi:hypothetical protein